MIVKSKNILEVVQKAAKDGRLIPTLHAKQRMVERNIKFFEIVDVISNGIHEAEKDEWHEAFRNWTYSIRGKTEKRRELRVAVSIAIENNILVVTVIDLSKKRRIHEEK